MTLPDTFQFRLKEHPGFTHSAIVVNGKVKKWAREYLESLTFDVDEYFWTEAREDLVQAWVDKGVWLVVEENKNTLTTEQLRRNKEINEQVAALDSSIKIAEQNVEHQRRLIASYEDRKEILKKGLVEEWVMT